MKSSTLQSVIRLNANQIAYLEDAVTHGKVILTYDGYEWDVYISIQKTKKRIAQLAKNQRELKQELAETLSCENMLKHFSENFFPRDPRK